MGVLFDCRWIDPTDMTVHAAVNQIDAAMSSVTEDEDRRPRDVELHHGFADRKALQGGDRFGNDRRIALRRFLLAGRGTATVGPGAST